MHHETASIFLVIIMYTVFPISFNADVDIYLLMNDFKLYVIVFIISAEWKIKEVYFMP